MRERRFQGPCGGDSVMKWFIGSIVATLLMLVFVYKFYGYQSAFTAATSIYGAGVTLYNILYHKNRQFYLFVNRLWFKVARTHTFWNVSFRFSFKPDHDNYSSILIRLAERFRGGRHGKA